MEKTKLWTVLTVIAVCLPCAAQQPAPLSPIRHYSQTVQHPIAAVLQDGIVYTVEMHKSGELAQWRLAPVVGEGAVRVVSLAVFGVTGAHGVFPVHWRIADGYVWAMVDRESGVDPSIPSLLRFAVTEFDRRKYVSVPPYPYDDAIRESTGRKSIVFGSIDALSASSVHLFVLKPPLMLVWENKDPAIPDQAAHSRSVEGRTNDKDRIENWSKVASFDVPFVDGFEAIRSGAATYFVTESGDVYAAGDLKEAVRKLDIGANKITTILTDDGKHKTYLIAGNAYAPLSDTPAFQPIDPTPDAKALTPQESVMALARKLK